MGEANAYTGSPIDRLGERRKDAAFVAGLIADREALVLPMRGTGHLLDGDGAVAMLRRGEAPAPLAAALEAGPVVLLGLRDGRPVVAVDLGEDEADGAFADLRQLVANLPGPDAAILAHARGLLHWRRTHRHCGLCGQPCRPEEGGAVVRCTGCGTAHFPRTDPAVIMLVTRRDADGERALLARNVRFGERRVFSTLAGFVEPGESLEEAVAREVAEECGVAVRDVRYHSSQPWPFPASIMLGFFARTDDARAAIDDVEIVEAGFFTRDEVRDHERLGFVLPPPTSIARRLIDNWCDGKE